MKKENRRRINGLMAGPISANIRKEKSISLIRNEIINWDSIDGLIRQIKLANKTSLSVKTIKRHWHFFKSTVAEINLSIKKELGPDYLAWINKIDKGNLQ